MRNALIRAAGGLALVAPLTIYAAETLNEAPVYDPYQTYTLWVTNASTPYVGPVTGPETPETVVAQIPEPGALILVLTGLGLLAYSTRRRKQPPI